MKALKIVGLVVAAIIIVAVLVSFFLPSSVDVSRSTMIEAPPSVVFAQVNTLRNWEAWSPWHKLDPQMKLQYEGPASGLGAKYSWESQQRNVGNGTLSITESVQDQRIRTGMDFREQGTATALFEFVPAEPGTKVTWTMHSDLGKNPIARYFGLFMDGLIGRDFERGLANLKAVSEKATPPGTPPASP